MIRAAKDLAKRHWPALRLRTLLFLTLLLVAALPGVGAVFLRVYENTLVQQTEAELIAQGAVLAGAYRAAWPEPFADPSPGPLRPERPTIDLNAMPILGEQASGRPGPTTDPRARRTAA
ncbi:MAG TPA: sensor histidine kinase, partial [Allosphingosinicella sp.]|nr:sensor histidine kinase [Allosphingosinicella sp.]